MCHDLEADFNLHAGDTGHSLHGSNSSPTYQFDLALGWIPQLNLKCDARAVYLNVLDGFSCHQILAGVGINDLRQRCFDCFDGDAHYFSLKDIRKSKLITLARQRPRHSKPRKVVCCT